MDDTIFALSSGPGRAAIAVIRASGPAAAAALAALSGAALPAPRRAGLRRLKDPSSGDVLDEAIVLWLPGPRTVTGEDVVEFHVHGGRAVVAGVLEALAACDGLRAAEPGEFTRRAFARGRMDLTQVEGLADLIAAETAGQRRLALAQAEGALAARCTGWRDQLVQALALIEAEIDFSDEDLPDGLGGAAMAALAAVLADMRAVLDTAPAGEIMRDGVHVAILGPPNVGKSSLLNRLAGRQAAIVSDISGTTRDVVEVHLDLGGIPIILADTAGLRAAADTIEREGIARAQARARAADIALWVVDLTDGGDRAAPAWPQDATGRRLVVGNKVDCAPPQPGCDLCVSAATGAGVAQLEKWLAAAAADMAGATGTASVIGRARQAAALRYAVAALARAVAADGAGREAALVGEEVRLAVRALGRLVGAVDVEDVLDIIFADFCIGK